MQTSTVTVAVLPEPPEGEWAVSASDLEWTTTRGSGPGGQNRNKVETAVVVRHALSGITVRCETERSQFRNRELALRILEAKLRDLHESEAHAVESRKRKNQVGSGQRGDKRRTIRVRDGRVTDHVTGQSWTLKAYLNGEW